MVEAAGGMGGAAAGAAAAFNWSADARVKERIEALNSSGRHVVNITTVNGTTYADVEVCGGGGANAERRAGGDLQNRGSLRRVGPLGKK